MRSMKLALFAFLTGIPLNAQTNVSKLQYSVRTLPNGLQVVSSQDRSSPTVSIQVWYKVGSKDDPPGRSGFAHLFEHMMFKSTEHMASEMFDRLTEDVGGENNAGTTDDYTFYYEVVPSNYLETLLWAEADRMGSLKVNAETFDSERDVVKEEFRERILAPPYGRLYYAIDSNSFIGHPYRRPAIGSIEDLDAATLEDVIKFHRTFYRPDNATLIVVGDFDQAQLDAWVDRYFGPIPKPAPPVPRVTVKEPLRTGERRITTYGANVPLPAVAITYLTPSDLDPDSYALQVADNILSAGQSSRLYQALVYRQRVAQSATSSADLREDAGLFIVQGTAASGKTPEELERALLDEIERIRSTPVDGAELQKARNLALAGILRSRERNDGRGFALGVAATYGDIDRVNADVDKLQAVTTADVQRVMQKYLTAENRLIIHYLPESQKPKSTSATTKKGARP